MDDTQGLTQVDVDLVSMTMSLAELGRPAARPNPVVGAVLAMPDGEVLATGHHARIGEQHAERACLDAWQQPMPSGATLYVSLEPCAHEGRQPPCTDLVIQRGVRRVVYGSRDTDPATAGQGPARMREAGIEVRTVPEHVERIALQQNAGFHSLHVRQRPYVTAKWAMTRNGRFATGDPQRRWISCETSRNFVPYLRAGSGAILVGIGTVLADDPELTVRGPLAERIVSQPLRIVLDRHLRIPLDCRLVRTATAESPVLVVTSAGCPPERIEPLRAAGVTVWVQPPSPAPLEQLLLELGRRQIGDLLVEAGPTLVDALSAAGLIDALSVFVAPFDAPVTEPGLPEQHPLMERVALTPPQASGVDEHHVAVVNSAWEIAVGAVGAHR